MAEGEVIVGFASPIGSRDQTVPLLKSNRRCSAYSPLINEGGSQGDIRNGIAVSDSSSESGSDRHCHELKTYPDIDKVARRKLIIACCLSLFFMIGEVAGGILAHSLAIVSDAAHQLTDLASFLISLLAIYLASRQATTKLSFGWYRAEILGALMSILFLWVVTGVLVYMAIQRVIHEDYEIDAVVMLITASCGVVFNIVMGCTLHTHGHSHGGGPDHGHSHCDDKEILVTTEHDPHQGSYGTIEPKDIKDGRKKKGHKIGNINVRAAFIHALGDFIQSVGVLIAALIIYFKPEAKLADPICTFVFSIFVIFTTTFIMRDILMVLMEGKPKGLSYKEIRSRLYRIEGVKDIHDLRIWSLSLNKLALSVHIAVEPGSDTQVALEKASLMVQQTYGILETTIQVEVFVDDMIDCTHCRDLTD